MGILHSVYRDVFELDGDSGSVFRFAIHEGFHVVQRGDVSDDIVVERMGDMIVHRHHPNLFFIVGPEGARDSVMDALQFSILTHLDCREGRRDPTVGFVGYLHPSAEERGPVKLINVEAQLPVTPSRRFEQ